MKREVSRMRIGIVLCCLVAIFMAGCATARHTKSMRWILFPTFEQFELNSRWPPPNHPINQEQTDQADPTHKPALENMVRPVQQIRSKFLPHDSGKCDSQAVGEDHGVAPSTRRNMV